MVYLVALLTIHDRARYQQYEAGFVEIFMRFGGSLLSVEESPTVLEGDWPLTRTVLISFPSQAEAMAWYRSDDYQALMQHRLAASVGNIALLNALPTS